jgi:hypothetical protein
MGTRASASLIIESEKGLDNTDTEVDDNSDDEDNISNNKDGNRNINKKVTSIDV